MEENKAAGNSQDTSAIDLPKTDPTEADSSINMDMEELEDTEDPIKEPLSVDTSETVSVDGERLRYILGSNSSSGSSPAKVSSGSTTPTGKSSPPMTPSPSSPSSPALKSSDPNTSKSSGSTSITPTTTQSHRRGCPSRSGITWKVNAKIEALDFQKKWYSARIVELDDTDHTVLVHFDGWNSRYDEWMDMKSDRIRPFARHSDRKREAARLKASLQEHRLGDNVFAKWTDCRMYAGTIVGVNSNGSYEVLFYDGFKKAVQPINVKTMTMEVQKEYAVAGILPDPTKRLKEKMQLVTRLEREVSTKDCGTDDKQTELTTALAATSSSATATSAESSPKEKSPPVSDKEESSKVKRKLSRKGFPCNVSSPKAKRGKLGGNFQLKRLKQQAGKLKKHEGRTDMLRKKQSQFLKGQKKVLREKEARKMLMARSAQKSAAKDSQDDTSDEDIVLARLIDPKLAEDGSIIHPGGLEPKNAFKVEAEHNKCKCPFENCNKSFRKMSLVDYHIKYYHTDDGTQPPAMKRRRKTLSVCSSDSEMSTSRAVSSTPATKRNREASSVSMEIPSDSSRLSNLEDVMLHDLSEVETLHTTTTEEQDTRDAQVMGEESRLAVDKSLEQMDESACDRLSKEELVNCICQINEENGLMIQCDVCLCWQHAVCMELTEEVLPSKYICYVCANPPGVRDRGRYNYDQDWLKQGTIARFNFLPPDPFTSQKAQIMQATHSLVADVHSIKSALHSTKCQIHALEDKNHTEVKFWSENWDKLKAEKLAKEAEVKLKEELGVHELSHSEPAEDDAMDTGVHGTRDHIEGQSLGIFLPENIDNEEKSDTKESENNQNASSGGAQKSEEDKDKNNVDQHTQALTANASSSSLSSLRSTGSDDCFQRTATPSGLTALAEEDLASSPADDSGEKCERNLLEHVSTVHDKVDSQLEVLEEQISALEAADDSGSSHSSGDVLRDLPRLKKAINQILGDLVKVKHMSLYH